MGLFELLIALFIGAMTYLANLADLQKLNVVSDNGYVTIVRRMLLGLIVMVSLYGLYANRILLLDLPSATLQELGINPDAVSTSSFIFITLFTFIICATALSLLYSSGLRIRVQQVFGKQSSYRAESNVHQVAIILALCLIGYLFINFIISGGLEGVAQTIQENGISLTSIIFQGMMFVVIALLGVGLAIRRSLPQTLERLGLQTPTPQNILMGILSGLILIAASLVLTRIWTSIVTVEQYAQQSAAAAEFDNQFNTIPAIFILAITSAVGEEVLFRGALQPIFGLPATTLFFVLFHDQYTLTPAMLIILVIGFGLGLLRRYQGTTSAIIAHFIYNFLPIAIIIALPQLAQSLGIS